MIALDTSALIWAVQERKRSTATAEERIAALEKLGSDVILPAPAVAEYLQRFKPSERSEALRRIHSFAQVAAFDYGAMTICADLFGAPGRKGTKQAFKVDAMILAVALANKATTLVADDLDFESLAKDRNINILKTSQLAVEQMLPIKLPLKFLPGNA